MDVFRQQFVSGLAKRVIFNARTAVWPSFLVANGKNCMSESHGSAY